MPENKSLKNVFYVKRNLSEFISRLSLVQDTLLDTYKNIEEGKLVPSSKKTRDFLIELDSNLRSLENTLSAFESDSISTNKNISKDIAFAKSCLNRYTIYLGHIHEKVASLNKTIVISQDSPKAKLLAILELPPSVSDWDLVKTTYRKLAVKYHPDRSSSVSDTQKMAEINKAYSDLKKEFGEEFN